MMETDMRTYLLWTLCAMVLCGCSRSPAEQLAYQHAEEQSQINRENFERYRQAMADDDDRTAAPVVLTSRRQN
ncbi:hypothetical protein LBW87_02045 [Herbaspirillum seropedicae]|nr:hypothetical protein [Herbaspirillum sp. alder98]